MTATETPLATLLKLVAESGLSDRRFATEVMGIDERTFRRYKAGAPMPKSKINLLPSLRINIRKRKQGVSPKRQREALVKAQAKRERRAERLPRPGEVGYLQARKEGLVE